MPKAARGIRADMIYPIRAFTVGLGIGRHSLMAMRRRGLPIRSIGQRLFVDGEEALQFLRGEWRGQAIQQRSTEEQGAIS